MWTNMVLAIFGLVAIIVNVAMVFAFFRCVQDVKAIAKETRTIRIELIELSKVIDARVDCR